VPELPEVETIRRDLEKLLTGKIISAVRINDPMVITGISPKGTPRRKVNVQDFINNISGKEIKSFLRRGKYLIMDFTGNGALIFHLRMTGQLLIGQKNGMERIQFFFKGDPVLKLSFFDRRRFGEVLYSHDWKKELPITALGVEPLNGKLDGALLKEKFRGRSASIHSMLLSQYVIAGLGNIYATEALFSAGIRPGKAAGRISLLKCDHLCSKIKKILQDSIDHRGYSMSTYVDAMGRKGETQKFTSVYGKEGKPCPLCSAPLKRTVLSARGVVYCAHCQS